MLHIKNFSILFLQIIIFTSGSLSSKLYKYRYKCTTDNKLVYEWRDGEGVPTACIEGAGHTVDWNSLTVVSIKEDPAPVSIANDPGTTQGFYKAQSFIVSTTNDSVGSVFTTDYSFPFVVSGLSMTLTPGTKNIGDKVSLLIAPDTDCGVAAGDSNLGRVTATVNISDTVLTVDAAVLATVRVGYLVKLQNGGTTQAMGRCIAKNSTNSTITVETAATSSFAANTTHVLFTIEKIKDVKFYSTNPIILGSSSIGGSEVPAGVIGRIVYTNTTGGAKDFGIIMEWME